MTFVPPTADETIGIFVSAAGVADNPGTRAAPLASIAQAATLAARDGKVVFVAAGTYREQVRASVSLFGGYSPDFRTVDPNQFLTEIIATGSSHSTVALKLESGEVTVHGFTLRGGESTYASAVSIEVAARPMLIHNVLHGGGRGPTGGMTFSWGINVPSYPQPVYTLRENTIHGGSNQYCRGIAGCAEGSVIERNTISGGGNTGEQASSITQAIHAGGGFTLADNTIDSGIGSAWAYAVSIYGRRATIVTGNRITTPGGVWHDCLAPGTGGGHVIRGNTFDGIPDEECFAWATKLEARTWRFNASDGEGWAWQEVELVPWGWLHFTSDSEVYQAQSSGVGPQYGPTQTFGQFLDDGPPAMEKMPDALAEEIRALLLAAGCTPEALASLADRARRDALYRAVLADPERNGPRLRYAEHLEKSGDEVGEYIRLCVEVQHPKSGYIAERTNRVTELTKRHEQAMGEPLAPWVRSVIVERGLVSFVRMDARTFIDAGHEVFARAPVVHLDLENAKPIFAALVACPLLARIRTLSISYDHLGDEEAALLAASTHVRQLRYLSLTNNQIGQAGLEAITASPNLTQLQSLWFMANAVDDPVSRHTSDYDGEPIFESAGPIQAVLEAKYGRKVWMETNVHSPSRFDLGRAVEDP